MTPASSGWYPDPANPDQQRFWDGAKWTEHVAPGTTASLRAAPVPAAPHEPVLTPPTQHGPAPAGSTSAKPKMSTAKKWLVGAAIAVGVLIVGSVGGALGSAGNRTPEAAREPLAAAPSAPEATPTPTAEVENIPEPATTPAPVYGDPVSFKAQANSHLDDINKDLDDIVVTVEESGFWRLLSNTAEIAFNYGQLDALDLPQSAEATWPPALLALDQSMAALNAAVETQDGPSILAAVEALRAQVEATRTVVNAVS